MKKLLWIAIAFCLGGGALQAEAISWKTDAARWQKKPSKSYKLYCPPGKPQGELYGTGYYTTNSPVCTAAVHAGAITAADGGWFKMWIWKGRSKYWGMKKNGITSKSLSTPYQWSFSIMKMSKQPPPPKSTPTEEPEPGPTPPKGVPTPEPEPDMW